jgi:FkbM family methyltransferase
MLSFRGLAKPQYLFRPGQIFRRFLLEVRPLRPRETLVLPWGTAIEVDTADTVGNAIAMQGIYDIITTEVLWRLTSRGDKTIDVGANIGYMTSVLAVRAGPQGEVIAFEPHPETFRLLEKNVAQWSQSPSCAPVKLHRMALSNSSGTASLCLFAGAENNTSFAYLNSSSPPPDGGGISVATARLETILDATGGIGVLKIDAQWHEAAVLEGAGAHLRAGTVRDIVFEEEAAFPAESHRILLNAGYTIYWFEEHLSGPRIIPPTQPCKRRVYDLVPSYLATKDPQRATRLLSPRGWQSL